MVLLKESLKPQTTPLVRRDTGFTASSSIDFLNVPRETVRIIQLTWNFDSTPIKDPYSHPPSPSQILILLRMERKQFSLTASLDLLQLWEQK